MSTTEAVSPELCVVHFALKQHDAVACGGGRAEGMTPEGVVWNDRWESVNCWRCLAARKVEERRWIVDEEPCFSPHGGLTHRMNCTGSGCDCRAVAESATKRLTAVDEKYAPHDTHSVHRAVASDAIEFIEFIEHHRGGARVFNIPTEELPRVVRELAALMTEEQRNQLAGFLSAQFIRKLSGLTPGQCAVCGASGSAEMPGPDSTASVAGERRSSSHSGAHGVPSGIFLSLPLPWWAWALVIVSTLVWVSHSP